VTQHGKCWTEAGHRNCQTNLRLSEHTDMTIHWKALEEHFLIAPLVFRFNLFQCNFWIFLKKPQSFFYFDRDGSPTRSPLHFTPDFQLRQHGPILRRFSRKLKYFWENIWRNVVHINYVNNVSSNLFRKYVYRFSRRHYWKSKMTTLEWNDTSYFVTRNFAHGSWFCLLYFAACAMGDQSSRCTMEVM
jgi:hypothetical protein